MRKRQKGSKPGLQYEKVGCQFGVLPTKEVGPVPSFEPELNSSRMFCTEQARTCLFKYLCRCVKVAKPEDVLIDTGRPSYCVKYGEHIHLCGYRRSFFPFQCSVGPDWTIVIIVYVLIIVINTIVLSVISPLGWPPVFIGIVGAVALLICYSLAACSDNGMIFKNPPTSVELKQKSANIPKGSVSPSMDLGVEYVSAYPEQTASVLNEGVTMSADSITQPSDSSTQSTGIITMSVESSKQPVTKAVITKPSTMECGICRIERPSTAIHCQACKVCINSIDHHCPWCGKCIASKNLMFFRAFIGVLSCQCYFLIGALIYFGISNGSIEHLKRCRS